MGAGISERFPYKSIFQRGNMSFNIIPEINQLTCNILNQIAIQQMIILRDI